MSHKRIYHLGHNCFLGKDRLQFLMLQIGKLALQLLHSGSASVRVCMCVCVCVCVRVCVCVTVSLENGARSVVSAGVNTAKTIKVDACVWEHRSPSHRSVSLGVGSCEWLSESCWSHWEPAAVNKHIKAQQGSAYCKKCSISCKSCWCTCNGAHTRTLTCSGYTMTSLHLRRGIK